MPLDRQWIEGHVPHEGRMCLLDAVLDWSTSHITCRGSSHRDPGNPLRAAGTLGVACGIEYAAQTMAVHAALTAIDGGGVAPLDDDGGRSSRGSPGFLAGVREVEFFALRLDDVPEDLVCTASRLAGGDAAALYRFAVSGGMSVLLRGRATVLFESPRILRP